MNRSRRCAAAVEAPSGGQSAGARVDLLMGSQRLVRPSSADLARARSQARWPGHTRDLKLAFPAVRRPGVTTRAQSGGSPQELLELFCASASYVLGNALKVRGSSKVMARAGGPRAVKRNLSLWSTRKYDAIDGRLLEAREEKRLVKALSEHVGQPTFPQTLLIKRTARSLVMVSILERRVLERQEFGDLQARQLLALSNSIRLNLVALGLKKAETQATLKSYLGGKAAREWTC
jgi:hypothetical protein